MKRKSDKECFDLGFKLRNHCESCDRDTLWRREIMIVRDTKLAMYECCGCGFYSTREHLKRMNSQDLGDEIERSY